MMPSDGELPALLATNLDRHFKQLVLSYQQRLYTFILRQTGSLQETEDIVQEAFIRAYYALADYPAERIQSLKLQAWLFKITLNVFYRRMGHARLQLVSLDTSEASMHLTIEDDEYERPEHVAEERERLHELEAMVATLPPHYREAVNLYYFEELGYREIAELLNQPLGTVKSNVHRGTRLLRQALDVQRSR